MLSTKLVLKAVQGFKENPIDLDIIDGDFPDNEKHDLKSVKILSEITEKSPRKSKKSRRKSGRKLPSLPKRHLESIHEYSEDVGDFPTPLPRKSLKIRGKSSEDKELISDEKEQEIAKEEQQQQLLLLQLSKGRGWP